MDFRRRGNDDFRTCDKTLKARLKQHFFTFLGLRLVIVGDMRCFKERKITRSASTPLRNA